MSEIFRECIKTYPNRPKLNPSEWPYSRDELNDRTDYWMRMIDSIGSAPVSAFPLISQKPVLHNGRKPR